jgi:hypothetical protein
MHPEFVDQRIASPGRRRAITSLIVLVIGLQAIAGFKLLCPPKALGFLAPLRIACPPTLWPFTDYPMYSRAWAAGSSLPRFRVVGYSRLGAALPFEREEFGVTHRRYREQFVQGLLIQAEDLYRPVLDVWRARYPELSRVELVEDPIVVLEGGDLVDGERRTLRSYRLADDGSLIDARARPR